MSVVDRVYARALFEAALEANRLDLVREQLQQLVTAEAEVPELRELLRNPQLDPRARAAALEDLLSGGEEVLRKFLLVLVDKGRTGELEEIAREFDRLFARHEGIVRELDRGGELGPEDRGESPRRPGPDRRDRDPGRLAQARRERARAARAPPQRISHRMREESW